LLTTQDLQSVEHCEWSYASLFPFAMEAFIHNSPLRSNVLISQTYKRQPSSTSVSAQISALFSLVILQLPHSCQDICAISGLQAPQSSFVSNMALDSVPDEMLSEIFAQASDDQRTPLTMLEVMLACKRWKVRWRSSGMRYDT
jgi:hypothetical protein